MSINIGCSKRIKPQLLREQKTEALLVFIRTTLEQYFKELDNGKINVTIGTPQNTLYINTVLRKLLDNLQECVVNSTYLRSLVINGYKNQSLKMILKKEEPLMVYYDSIVKGIEIHLPNGSSWIPELMVIALLSEWILEEERSVYLYPFLEEIDYIDLLEKYDLARLSTDDEKKEIIMDMYKLSTTLIKSLKNINYKINTTRKKRKK
jgi:hypothetical protein